MTQEEKLDAKLALASARKCDKYDYLIAVGCGVAAGLMDIFLVGAPKESILGNWTDAQTDKMVMKFASITGWKGGENGKDVKSAIGFLENKYRVNYDQRYTGDVGNAFRMGTKNHHLKSLAHSPDIIGLFFSILDQFQGKASFIADGQLIRVDTSDSDFALRGNDLPSKLFCGFCNWIGHIMSDIAGSSGAVDRGSGLAIPFYELFQLFDFGKIQIGQDRQSFAVLMTRVFQAGYDIRFGAAMAIPVVLSDLCIRAMWALKQHYYHKEDWQNCIPTNKHGDLRWMLIVGNTTLCVFDGVDAVIRSKGDPIKFVLRLNLIAWTKLVMRILKEILLRYDFTYADLNLEFERINRALDEELARLSAIDYEAYQKELQGAAEVRNILMDDDANLTPVYEFLEEQGCEMQFHSSEEYIRKMQDPNFVLKI